MLVGNSSLIGNTMELINYFKDKGIYGYLYVNESKDVVSRKLVHMKLNDFNNHNLAQFMYVYKDKNDKILKGITPRTLVDNGYKMGKFDISDPTPVIFTDLQRANFFAAEAFRRYYKNEKKNIPKVSFVDYETGIELFTLFTDSSIDHSITTLHWDNLCKSTTRHEWWNPKEFRYVYLYRRNGKRLIKSTGIIDVKEFTTNKKRITVHVPMDGCGDLCCVHSYEIDCRYFNNPNEFGSKNAFDWSFNADEIMMCHFDKFVTERYNRNPIGCPKNLFLYMRDTKNYFILKEWKRGQYCEN